MRVRPVVTEAAIVVDAVAESLGRPLLLQGELDVDVYRLHRTQAEPDLVARVVGPGVERTTVDASARVLLGLADTRFPAERCPTDTPVLAIGDGRHVLVTEYVESSPAPGPGFVQARCAGLLTGLPEALIHADLTPPNAVPRGKKPPVVIDWIGVGRGPRVWPPAFLLFAAGPRGARRVFDRYSRSIALSDEERHRLPGVMIARPLTLDVWSVAYERMTAQQAITRLRGHRARVDAVVRALPDHDRP